MRWIDYVILFLVAAAAWRGWRVGALGQLGALIGRLVGFFVGVTYGPRWATALVHSHWRPVAAVGIMVAALVLGGTLGRFLGRRLAKALPLAALRVLDSLIGAAVSVTGTLVLLWLVATVFSVVSIGGVASEINGSMVLTNLQRVLPTPPAAVGSLQVLLSSAHLPNIFSRIGSGNFSSLTHLVVTAPATTTSQSGVVSIAASGGCATPASSSGFAVGPNEVVTTASAVAGYHQLLVNGHVASAVWFDPQSDVAVLRVSSLGSAPLSLATNEPPVAAPVSVIASGAGNQTASPGLFGGLLDTPSRSIYSGGLFTRTVAMVATSVTPTAIGAPVLNHGQVVAMIVAPTSVSRTVAVALPLTTLRAALSKASTTAVSTMSCVS